MVLNPPLRDPVSTQPLAMPAPTTPMTCVNSCSPEILKMFTTIMVVMATTTTVMKDLAMCGRGWDACHTADHHHHGGGQDHGEAEAGQKEFEHNQETRKFRRKMNRYI